MEREVRFYCPNCGQLLRAESGEGRVVRAQCPKCKSMIFSKQNNKREILVKYVR